MSKLKTRKLKAEDLYSIEELRFCSHVFKRFWILRGLLTVKHNNMFSRSAKDETPGNVRKLHQNRCRRFMCANAFFNKMVEQAFVGSNRCRRRQRR